ncbi:MAG: carboxypeptidase-like regulatory domain-containing protein [Acidobacteriota bacterium]
MVLMDAEQTFTSGNLSSGVDAQTKRFRMEHVVPAKYYLSLRLEHVYLESIRFGGQDVTRVPLDLAYGGIENLQIVLGAKPGVVQATVRNRNGDVMPRVLVALWPEVADLGTSNSGVRVVTTNDLGNARFIGLRPEKYRVAAFKEVEAAFVRSPDFLDRFKGRAVEVTVTEGGSFTPALEAISRDDAAVAIRNLP